MSTLNKKEQFAVGFHEWCMNKGFIGFNKANYQTKLSEYKIFLKQIPQRPEANKDPFFNIGLHERQQKWDKEYLIFINALIII